MNNKLFKDKDSARSFNDHVISATDLTQISCFQTAILMKRQTNVLQEMEHTIVNTVTQQQKLLWAT
jgi:hypothetical protein